MRVSITGILLTLGLYGQATTNAVIQPDCVQTFVLTAAGNAPTFKNYPAFCLTWTISYTSTGFSGLSITVQSAPDNAGSAGTFVTYAGTVNTGVNPNTTTTSNTTTFTGYYPWMRVNLSGLTGSGKITGILYGYKAASARSGGGGGGGSPGGSINDIQFKAGASTFGGGRCTMDSSQNIVCTGSYTAGSGSGTTGRLSLTGATSAATSVLTVDDTNTATTVKLPNDATSGLYAATSTLATPASGCAQFNGTGTELASTGVACGSGGGGGSGSNIATYSAPAVTLPAAGTTFFPPGGGGLPSGTEANIQGASPVATISSFYVQMSSNIGGGNTIALTFRKGGVDQAVTCTISGASNACNDTTHTFGVAAGDLLSIKAVTTGTVIIAPTMVIMYSTGSSGGSSTTVHHQFFTGAVHAGTCTGGVTDASGSINGTAATNLCGSNPLGITGPYNANTLGSIYVFLPPTWPGTALTITLESSTSTNATGNFSFTPAYSCVASGKDMTVAPTYTAGSTTTVAAPGGAGSGFYRVPVSLSITPTCTSGQGVQLKFTRGGSDAYADSIYIMGADLAITY